MGKLTEQRWGFEVTRSRLESNPRRVARFTCVGCSFELEVNGRGNLAPDYVLKSARRQGWECDERNPSLTYCPSCIAKRKSKPEVVDMADVKRAPDVRASSAVAREPTQAERLKIRSILDKQFDDSSGCWLDGYSDQRAGEELGVPWSLVTKIREAAYGPIRVDPEIVAMRAEIAGLTRDAKALSSTLAGLTDKIADIERRFASFQTKRAS